MAPTGSFTSGLRRVHSVLSQFRQSELKQLRQSSLEWVFGLTGRAGSCMYMAPEVFRKLPYNEKADVFSFGVVMYELLSRELLVISYFNTSRGAKLGMHQPEDYAEMVRAGVQGSREGGVRASVPKFWGPTLHLYVCGLSAVTEYGEHSLPFGSIHISPWWQSGGGVHA